MHIAPEGTPANSTGNRIIHGDNLEALKALLPEFEGRVQCIYIDPPYNTGNVGWVYNDNVNDPRTKKWLHQVVGKEGEDLSRHDKWLCMMYPRQPHVVAHQEPLLNMSYVFTASNKFMDTLDKVVKGLNRAGFSDRDYRAFDGSVLPVEPTKPVHPDLFSSVSVEPPPVEYSTEDKEIDIARLEGCITDGRTVGSFTKEGTAENDPLLAELTARATETNQEFTEKAKDADSLLSPDLESRMNTYPIKEIIEAR